VVENDELVYDKGNILLSLTNFR